MSQIIQQLGIDHLSVDDRLDLIGQIWDSLRVGEDALLVPDWHRRELEGRLAYAGAAPEAGVLREVVKARLADRS